jgi:hypothetical protein
MNNAQLALWLLQTDTLLDLEGIARLLKENNIPLDKALELFDGDESADSKKANALIAAGYDTMGVLDFYSRIYDERNFITLAREAEIPLDVLVQFLTKGEDHYLGESRLVALLDQYDITKSEEVVRQLSELHQPPARLDDVLHRFVVPVETRTKILAKVLGII